MSIELEEFKTETLETLDRAEKALLEFDQLPENESSPALFDEVFRVYHNIKGAAGMVEWPELEHHVHQLENVLMQSKESSSIPKHLISWFLKGNDAARSIVANEPFNFDYKVNEKFISNNSVNEKSVAEDTSSTPEQTPQEALPGEFYSEVNEGLDKISSILIKMETQSGEQQLLDELYREIHSLKGSVQLFGLQEASQLAHSMENSLENDRGLETFELDKTHVSTLLMCIDLMSNCIHQPNNPELKKEVSFMQTLLLPFCEKEKAIKLNTTSVAKIHQTTPITESDKQETTIRVQVSLLDRLMTLMGEMVLVRNQVLQYSNKNDDLEFLNLSQKLDVVTSELQEETMKTRMQPIGNILNKFQRMVRDLSGALNKKINLTLIGVETELDKTLIEAVKDPLTHIVRNACDHGVEEPNERLKKGKSEAGSITIKAYHESGQVVVDISDDGKGLSREKLLKKAIEKGVIDQSRAEKLTDREVHNLIFAPGFSTAEKVTNVSGRGVGMDVVKSNIEKIGGLVDISSVEGEGTKITLKIPLTLAIVPAMIIRSQNERFAIPQVKLVELVRIDKNAIEYVQGRSVYRLRGNILPLISLKEILGEEEMVSDEDSQNIVVLQSENYLFGMLVDEILDTADIVVKPLARFLKNISIYSGATVLGDGSVAFILDVLGIAQKHLGLVSTEEIQNVSEKYNHISQDELELREYVLVGVGNKTKYAIPLSLVSRMEEIKTANVELSGHQRVIRYRGGVLKLIKLNEVLGHNISNQENEIIQVIVVKMEDQVFGLEVDQIIDVYSSRDFLDESVSVHEAIIGNLVTEEEIIVVVDVQKVFELANPRKVIKKSFSLQNTNAKILVVEDTETIRNSIAEDLSSDGYQVEVASDGLEGLKKVVEHKFDFDLIISDLEMPKMNGFEFAKKIRSINNFKNIPIIAFTTKRTTSDLNLAKDSGFTTFLEKNKAKLLPLLVSECLTNNKRKIA